MMNLVESLKKSLLESDDAKIKELEKKIDKVEDKVENVEKEANKAEESIKDEKSFRDYAENKFKEVFGDDLDEKQMKEIIDGILNDNKDDADKGDWGKLVGILNKSFGEK